MSQEAGLAVSVSSLQAVNIWGDILKKHQKPGDLREKLWWAFSAHRLEEGSALPLSHSQGVEILVLDTVAVAAPA